MKLQTIIAVLCLLASIAANFLTPHQYLADLEPVNLEKIIPKQFGEWEIVDEPNNLVTTPEQNEFINSIYSQVLSRVYINHQNERIMLSIAYSRSQADNSGQQTHKPELCYPAQGFLISDRKQVELKLLSSSIPIVSLVAKQGARIEPINYWITVGKTAVNNGVSLKLAQLGYGFKGVIADGMVFRVSSINDDVVYGFTKQKQFLLDLYSALDDANKNRLGMRN